MTFIGEPLGERESEAGRIEGNDEIRMTKNRVTFLRPSSFGFRHSFIDSQLLRLYHIIDKAEVDTHPDSMFHACLGLFHPKLFKLFPGRLGLQNK
jgi:hypothetical protein